MTVLLQAHPKAIVQKSKETGPVVAVVVQSPVCRLLQEIRVILSAWSVIRKAKPANTSISYFPGFLARIGIMSVHLKKLYYT